MALTECCYSPSLGDVRAVKYFTAKPDNSRGDGKTRTRQATYVKALRAHFSGFQVQYGHYIHNKSVRGIPTDKRLGSTPIQIKTSEEKGSDVNLAVAMVSDAYQDLFDTAILISNDGDLRAPITVAKSLGKTVVVLIPWRKGRVVSKSLINTANDWFLIEPKHLAPAQLPNPVASKVGKIYKPPRW